MRRKEETMKISTAFRNAWKAYSFAPGETLKFFLTELCLTLICLAPLLSLTGGGKAGWMAWAAPALWMLVMLPARMNAASAMKNALRGGPMGDRVLAETRGYGEKLLCGLKRGGFLLLWGIPMIACGVIFRIHFSGDTDSFTVIRILKNDLGGGDYKRGLLVVAVTVAAALMVLLAGCGFHSGARHAFVRGDKGLVRGRHGSVLLCWLASQICVLPMLIAAATVIGRYVAVIQDLNGLLMKTVSLPSTRSSLIILAAGAVLTMPLLPLRSLITAAFVDGLKRNS